MKVNVNTIVRAFDHAQRNEYQKAASEGAGPYRGPYSHIGIEKEQRIVELIRSGMSDAKIAAKVGVSDGTVSRWRKKIQGEQSENGSL